MGTQPVDGSEGESLQDVWRRNRAVPASIEQCVHELLQNVTGRSPNSPALCAWDGEMTYGELDVHSLTLQIRGRIFWA